MAWYEIPLETLVNKKKKESGDQWHIKNKSQTSLFPEANIYNHFYGLVHEARKKKTYSSMKSALL